ncbi:hypothetical protein CNMCM6106_003086 [Aspergillus hiratsukae]|uniref:Major facilitator superfamily (MFS) profile domain-containing protein n=1 Tax=Aspergillus hiratsukae TaxID=1194566 RepID=A0A8H6UUP3_9EURO|nr:hypothetical protein CNMCM6106_003086 [Aspergillus hiratsukae]
MQASEKLEAGHEAVHPTLDGPELTTEHHEYLVERHGSVALDPLPSMDPADPYNWPQRKKITNLILVSFHAMMAMFTAASINSSFIHIAEDLDISVQTATYLASLSIAILGGAPLIWKPLANTYGRRPIFLGSLLCSMAGNIGCAVSPSYATMCVCRAIASFFISPAAAIGSGIVAEMFFKKELATFMGVWTIMVTLGVPLAAFIFGFVSMRVDYRWIYWILTITNGLQFICHFFLGAETLYRRDFSDRPHRTPLLKRYFDFGRINPQPIKWWDFVQPLGHVMRPVVWIPAMAYAMIFMWAAILPSIEIPQLYHELYGFNAQQIGLQYLSFIIGSVIGEQIGGRASDWWMLRREKKTGAAPDPEYRLWLSYVGQVPAIVGLIVFCVQSETSGNKWNITPLVGTTIAAVGNQIVTTIYITYAIDCYREEAPGIGVFISFVRQIWGFVGPFWRGDGYDGCFCHLADSAAAVERKQMAWNTKSWLEEWGLLRGGSNSPTGAAEH